ncbi:hypothetical protein BDP27DRAFT_372962 [Rhodocollybia butyracea]|uniref:Uncharacterized protein n=1 Tax=Rhodocollybia butyracea TaxID=206335 RepID=A0A9P5PV13_9AGAR|nr:hypothetical protein BDP27DRAFT_372962 [Rhodocollybia butyracea]
MEDTAPSFWITVSRFFFSDSRNPGFLFWMLTKDPYFSLFPPAPPKPFKVKSRSYKLEICRPQDTSTPTATLSINAETKPSMSFSLPKAFQYIVIFLHRYLLILILFSLRPPSTKALKKMNALTSFFYWLLCGSHLKSASTAWSRPLLCFVLKSEISSALRANKHILRFTSASIILMQMYSLPEMNPSYPLAFDS